MKVILGVSSSVAIYKACELVRALRREGADVTVIMTPNATHLIAPRLFDALTGNPTVVDLFDRGVAFGHLEAARDADCFVVAPATANVIGKLAAGIADDALTTTALAATCPRIVAPAMNPSMWGKEEVQDALKRLIGYGYVVVPPGEGVAACGDVGTGRLANVDIILEYILSNIKSNNTLNDISMVVTAGRTAEPFDVARVITNPAQGIMGYAVAREAGRRGARVTLITGNIIDYALPPKVKVVKVSTAAEMLNETEKAFSDADALVMAAAVSDFRPADAVKGKIKKSGAALQVSLQPTTDILAKLGAVKGRRYIVGFAAETDNLIQNAKDKLLRKNIDLVIANVIGKEGVGFGAPDVEAVLITQGEERDLGRIPKIELAKIILNYVQRALLGDADA